MENIAKILDLIYRKFVLRDIISIFFSGFILIYTIIALESGLGFDGLLGGLSNRHNSVIEYFIFAVFSYVTGMVFNESRDFIQFGLLYKDIFHPFKNLKKNYNLSKKISFRIKAGVVADDAGVFERQVVMFQTTGNIGLSILFSEAVVLGYPQSAAIIGFPYFRLLIVGLVLVFVSSFQFWEYTKLVELYSEE